MLTCACLFSRNKEIVDVCRKLDIFHVRLKIYDVVPELCRVDFQEFFVCLFGCRVFRVRDTFIKSH